MAGLHPSTAEKSLDPETLYFLLDPPAAGMPEPQVVRHSGDGVIIIFEVDSRRDRIKAILESNASYSALFESV